MKITPHKTATDTITQCMSAESSDFFANDVEACAMQTLVEAAQSSMDTLMEVMKERPDLVRDVVNVLDVELLENTDAWHTFAESCSTGAK